jgi:hypothetical protein
MHEKKQRPLLSRMIQCSRVVVRTRAFFVSQCYSIADDVRAFNGLRHGCEQRTQAPCDVSGAPGTASSSMAGGLTCGCSLVPPSIVLPFIISAMYIQT